MTVKAIKVWKLTEKGKEICEKVIEHLPDVDDPTFEIVLLRRLADYLEEKAND